MHRLAVSVALSCALNGTVGCAQVSRLDGEGPELSPRLDPWVGCEQTVERVNDLPEDSEGFAPYLEHAFGEWTNEDGDTLRVGQPTQILLVRAQGAECLDHLELVVDVELSTGSHVFRWENADLTVFEPGQGLSSGVPGLGADGVSGALEPEGWLITLVSVAPEMIVVDGGMQVGIGSPSEEGSSFYFPLDDDAVD